MHELLQDLARWQATGEAAVLARLVDVEGSGPRAPGAAMAVSERGEVLGSVTGGCVEGAVVHEAAAVLASGAPRIVTFGYGDDEALEVGLTCGGVVHLYLEPLDGPAEHRVDALRAAVAAHRPAVVATLVEGPDTGAGLVVVDGEAPSGGLPDADLDRVVRRDAVAAMAAGTSALRRYGPHGEADEDVVAVFYDVLAPPPRLLVFGAVDVTAALVRVAKVLGYHVTVCDAREVFATRARFPHADEVVVDWPQRLLADVRPALGPRDAVCVLTHDAKFDVPALVAALATRAGYVGAMGSRRTTEQRAARLRAEGVTEDQLARLHAPIGLDLSPRTPEETAIAICAEIIAERTGAPVPELRDTTGPIHR